MSKRRGVLVLVVLLALLAGGLAIRLLSRDPSPLDEALRRVPGPTLRVGFTDWAAARRITGIGQTTSAVRIKRLTDAAYARDLSATSAIDEGGAPMQHDFGFSPGTVDWEVLAQARKGAAEVFRLTDGVDPDQVRRALARTGFRKPAHDDGVWRGGADLVASLNIAYGTQLQNVVVLGDQRLVVTSDSASYAATAARVAAGHGTSLADADDTDALTDSLTAPAVSAMLWSRDFACEDLALSKAGPEDEAHGKQVLQAAGGVGPLTGLLMARRASKVLDVVERYESADRARRDLRARARLAVGEAVGRDGSFSDDYRLTRSRTDGANVVLTLRARPGTEFLLSALDNGPVVFASC